MRCLRFSAVLLLVALAACSSQPRASETRTNLVTAQGAPVALEGSPVVVGDKAPDFAVIANDGSTKHLSDYKGKTIILSTVPSLQTKVCDLETRTFNEKASAMGPNTLVLTVSTDTPRVQKDWCASKGVERVVTLSDATGGEVGRAYGLYMPTQKRLARAVLVIDPSGVIRYEQIVPELSHEPDYDAALKAAAAASKNEMMRPEAFPT